MDPYDYFSKQQLTEILSNWNIPFKKTDTKDTLKKLVKKHAKIVKDESTTIVVDEAVKNKFAELDETIDVYSLELKRMTDRLCKAEVPRSSFPRHPIRIPKTD